MTTPDKPEETGQETSAERTSVIAASQLPDLTGAPSDRAPSDRTPSDRTPGEDETAAVTPPPWQRVTADPSDTGHDTTESTTQNLTRNGDTPQATPSWPTETDATTVTVQRPVVSGTAAPRLFGGTTPPAGDSQDSGVRTGFGAGALGGLGATTSAPPSALRRPGRGPRRANLQIKRFDPWSVLKLSLVLGVALFFVWLVAVGALYAVLDGMGVWDKLNGISSELLNANTAAGGEPLISAGRVFGIAAIIGAINIVLFSALATVGAFVYNVSADLAGGLEVTLAERE
ncbi:DUF3566 domain-containing protein [Actinokineospora guangxiensis]|uniref:DUF3566 domain-containing protein n=1 Tax=Actinokineospora guangxiensis TaxID=1490288 RepID=A0ABW0EDP5_9PSEU